MTSPAKPLVRVAVLLDENTSGGATRYEAPKSLFRALAEAGALPLAVPYLAGLDTHILHGFDALVSPGGRFSFATDWYADNPPSAAPWSQRGDFEVALMRGFLEAGKPVLGVCSGMQMLAGLSGSKLTGDISAGEGKEPHNGENISHIVTPVAGTRLAALTGPSDFVVNSLHNEAVVEPGSGVTASAFAPDGTIEAIELDGHAFALGVQWHQERYQDQDHPGNAIFKALVEAASDKV